MAQTSNGARRNTWRAVLIGAAVPFALLAAAPAVGAAETDTVSGATTTVTGEQLPPVPGAPDPTALTDLATCLNDLKAALDAKAPAPGPAPAAEQLPAPPGGAPALPDIGALAQTCKDILASVKAPAPPPPGGAPAIQRD